MSGFTFVEMAVVIGIVMVAAAVGILAMNPMLTNTHVTTGYTTALTALRTARDSAVATRRQYQVTFTTPRTVTVTIVDTNTVIMNSTLPSDVAFDAEPGIPNGGSGNSTPDNFGSGASTGAIDFDADIGAGGNTTVYFYPDGSARDAAGQPSDGVLYLASPGKIDSSRAITVWGLTGRIRGWQINRNGSAGTYFWSRI